MAKPKASAGSAVANRPAYSRVSFLYQAAALLASVPATPAKPADAETTTEQQQTADRATGGGAPAPLQGMARRLLTQMRAVSRKTNMRLRPAMKHHVCKYCDTLLVEGATCVSAVENNSRGGRKPWADLLVVTCKTCGRGRRFPVAAPRQPRRPFRDGADKEQERGQEQDARPSSRTADSAQHEAKTPQGKRDPQAGKAAAKDGQPTKTSGKRRAPAHAKQGPR